MHMEENMNNFTWENSNTIKRFEEAKNNKGYLDDLRKLINGELVAAVQYQIAACGILGAEQSYLGDHFSAHAEEEWGHYKMLVDALMARGELADMNLETCINDAFPGTNELKSFNSGKLQDFFINAEDSAIKAYQAFWKDIQDEDPDLADIVNSIISDEREHKLDFVRMDGALN